MKIGYISHARYPSEKAYGVQMTRVCEAMAELGHEVTLVAPEVHNEVTESYDKYYDVKQQFAVEHLPTKDALLSWWVPGRFAMMVTLRSYQKSLRPYLAASAFDVLYVRSHHMLEAVLATNIPVVLELHTIPRRLGNFVSQCNSCALVVCLTTLMKEELVQLGVSEDKVIVEADAVALEAYANIEPHDFSLPTDRPIVGYVGSLSTMNIDKGAGLLLECAKDLQDNAFVFIVGGPENKAEEYRQYAKTLGLRDEDYRIEGPVPSRLVPAAISACDVCVYPAPMSDHSYFQRDTSPLKLFEYMASGVLIVCADIPPVRDIVDESSVWLFDPGDVDGLKEAASKALQNPKEAEAKAIKGKEIAAYHTWKKRMQRILTAISV